jgi:uncharacterized cupredoxin-like copper-binding protein
MRRVPVTVAAAALLATSAFGLVGCGGGGSSTGGRKNAPVPAGARVIDVQAQSFEFTPAKVDVTAGEAIAIKLSSSDTFHDFTIQGKGYITGADQGKSAEGGFKISKPGKYTFYCSVPGHRQAGMVGTITVS